MKTIGSQLLICFSFLLTMGACSTLFIEGASVQQELNEPIRKDSIIMKCQVNYIKINSVEKMYFPYRGKMSTLSLNYNGDYQGLASCNRFFGKYTMEGNHIRFKQALSTSVACSESIIEKAVLTALHNSNNCIIKDNQLLLNRDNEIMIVYDIE